MPRKKKDRKIAEAMANRLEVVRTSQRIPTLKAFRETLIESGAKNVPSYQAIQNYHAHRESPVSYLAMVSNVFSVDLAYLATGDRVKVAERRDPEDQDSRSAQVRFRDTVFRLEDKRYAAPLPFLAPLRRLTAHLLTFRVTDLTDDLQVMAGGDPDWPVRLELTTEELVAINEDLMEGDRILDATLARAWVGATEVLIHAFGPEVVDNMTLAKQAQFVEQVTLAIRSLAPDYGESAVDPEIADA